MKSLLFCITSTSILRSAMDARTSDQRRSSSCVEMGVLRRSFGSVMALPAGDEVDHMLALAGEEMAQIGLDDRERAVGIFIVKAAQMRRDDDVGHRPEAMVLGQR